MVGTGNEFKKKETKTESKDPGRTGTKDSVSANGSEQTKNEKKKSGEREEKLIIKRLFQQIDLKSLFETLGKSKFGCTLILIGMIILLGIFILISHLGGIIAGIVAVAAIVWGLFYKISPYIRIETINYASRGIPTILGRRIPGYILDEGATIVIENVPFFGKVLGYVPIHIGTVNIDFKNVKIFDKDHFDLLVSGAFSIRANPNELIKFQDMGGAHGLDDEGKTIKEKESDKGDKGIVDLLLETIQSALLKETGKLGYPEIISSRDVLENETLKKITMSTSDDVIALNPDKPYYLIGMGTDLLSFVISAIEPGEDLKEIITKQGTELAERKFRTTDAKTATLLYQTITGITDEELREVDKKVIERFYLRIKMVEQLGEKGNDVEFGKNILAISAAGFLDDLKFNLGDILNLLSKFKGGK